MNTCLDTDTDTLRRQANTVVRLTLREKAGAWWRDARAARHSGN